MKHSKRVVFYSKNDLMWQSQVKEAEKLLKNIDLSSSFGLNDLLEFYNIKLYFDNSLFLNEWNEVERNEYIQKANKLSDLARTFFVKEMNIEEIEVIIYELDFNYYKSFWKLIELYNIHKRIDKNIFSSILENHEVHLTYILSHEKIVTWFSEEVKSFLLNYTKTAELLLREYEEEHLHRTETYHFPKSLGLKEKEIIIGKYLDYEDANLNYVNLILNTKTTNNLRISANTKRKAKNKATELGNKVLEDGYTWNEGVNIQILRTQKEPRILNRKDDIVNASYSKTYLDNIENYVDLFHVFSELFEYTNKKGFITLISDPNQLYPLEIIQLKSKNNYKIGSVFNNKNILSYLQIIIFNDYLISRKLTVEIIINHFIKEYLNPIFSDKLIFDFPNINSTFKEKIRTLNSELDFLLKQFQTFVNEKELDSELMELDDETVYLSKIPSLTNKKYVYIKSDKVNKLCYYFFSDKCMLYYIEPYNDKYQNFYTLIQKENVRLEEYKDNRIDIIKGLIKDNYLIINKNGFLRLNQRIKLLLFGELFYDDVINYWRNPTQFIAEIDKMIEDDLLEVKDTLFTKTEVSYLNYYLNKKEFTNSLNIRNKYIHGTNPTDEQEQEKDYYELLKIIILVLLKIEDDIEVAIKIK